LTVNISNALADNGSRIITQWSGITPFSAKAANLVCLAFPGTFLAGTTALEISQPGYNRVADTISELVWGPTGWIENLLFMAFAAVLILFSLRMRAAAAPLVAASLGFAIISIFPTQAAGAEPSTASLIHQYAAQGIAAALPIACFCLARKLHANEEYRFIVTCSVTAGVIGLILNLAGFLALYGGSEWVGAAERLIMLNGLIWLQITGLHTWLSRRKSPSACCTNNNRSSTFANLVGRPAAQPVRVKTAEDHGELRGRR